MSSQVLFRKLFLILRYCLLAIVVLITLFPLYYMITTSFKTPIQTYDPSVWIFKPTMENYISLFTNYKVTRYIVNSVVVTGVSIALTLVLAS
ncbi:MAG: carbohydrate ABC transporter permease, partial [Chloroflexi bacterium]|nr:carbohydrate ABC transporter permease [Chloroflexota bacterium]